MVDPSPKDSEQLTKEVYALLREGKNDEALRVAATLEERCYSSCFEIEAIAHAAKGDLDAAVAVLERGTELAPDVWLNWQLLGNYRSDLGRYDQAAAAYDRAAACPKVSLDSVRLNRAILANRCKRFEAALDFLDSITDVDLAMEAIATRTVALNRLGRHTEAAALALKALTEADEDVHRTCLDTLAAEAVAARLALGEPTADVKAFALDAIENHGAGPWLLRELRVLDDQRSETAQYYRLLVHGTLAEEDPLFDEAKGFYSSVDAVADSVAEALASFRALIPQRVLASLEAEQVEILEPRPRDPKGVYRVSGYSFYAPE